MALTERERQILKKIEQNPMISQNELAEWCGITRSGVAAHISNLMKKGYIQGKGYVLTPPRYVAVIGAINIDVYGIADNDVVGESSNVGSIVSTVGGIARNVSFNLGHLGVRNYLISVYGDDEDGEHVLGVPEHLDDMSDVVVERALERHEGEEHRDDWTQQAEDAREQHAQDDACGRDEHHVGAKHPSQPRPILHREGNLQAQRWRRPTSSRQQRHRPHGQSSFSKQNP